MIIYRYYDDSEGYEYEVGDRVIVHRTIHDGWFDYGPTHSDNCIITKIENSQIKNFQSAKLYIRYSIEWGPASCFPWMIEPHETTMARAIELGNIVAVDPIAQYMNRNI